jgi:circadian clock protein KaiB
VKTKKNLPPRSVRAPGPVPARVKAAKYILRLFVAGATARSRQAVLRVRELCASDLAGDCRLEVIDIYQQPQLARAHQIVATPTLIKEYPRPVRRFIGNLLNTDGLFAELNINVKGSQAN